jgi:hypothetical protein
MKIKILPILLMVVMLMPLVAAAQSSICSSDGKLGECVSQIYIWSLGLSGILAVSVTVWGGYLVMSARGNGAQATKGKEYIYSALVGMVLLMSAYLLLNTINTDLTDFSTPSINQELDNSGKPSGTNAPLEAGADVDTTGAENSPRN